MNKFSWYEAASVEDALQHVNTTASEEIYKHSGKGAVLKAGGTDLLDLMKEGLLKPTKIVNIRKIAGLDKITFEKDKGLTLGANVTLADIESSEEVLEHYLALHEAVAHAATPQLRNMATLGGNLAQRTRCWYFRSEHHPCFRKGGDLCFARRDEAENENHAILNNGACVSVHASSVSTALMVLGATVELVNDEGKRRTVPIEDFFVHPGMDNSRECVVEANELITSVHLPAPSDHNRSAYIKQVQRASYDWSTADVAVSAEMEGNMVKDIRIALGAAAPTPIRSYEAEEMLKGKTLNANTARMAAEEAMVKARPLSKNAYKVPLFVAVITETLMELA